MMKYAIVAVGLALAAATGCAQCDTCDDFPAPCVGPNCGQNGYDVNGFVPPTQDGLPYDAAQATVPSNPDAAPVGQPDPEQSTAPTESAPGLPSPTMPPTSPPSPPTPPTPSQP